MNRGLLGNYYILTSWWLEYICRWYSLPWRKWLLWADTLDENWFIASINVLKRKVYTNTHSDLKACCLGQAGCCYSKDHIGWYNPSEFIRVSLSVLWAKKPDLRLGAAMWPASSKTPWLVEASHDSPILICQWLWREICWGLLLSW